MLSGSYGSAKSTLMAHIGLTHCLKFPKSRVLIGRKSMPDLKDTLLKKLLEHLDGTLIEDEHYVFNKSRSSITFWNGSEIISRSWADKKYRKLRSLELSAALIEELTENDSKEFEGFYKELVARVGRLASIPEKFILCATNPDSPAHAAYEYFVTSKNPNRKVFYSVTTENPFLPDDYVDQLKSTLTAQEIRRYIYGEWIEIQSQVIYYAYDREASERTNLTVNPLYPLILTFDFNIALGKPMSCIVGQEINEQFYCIDESIIHGARTLDVLEDLEGRGYINPDQDVIIYGDATGRHRDTRSIHSDYDLIFKFLSQRNIIYENEVPRSNPPIKTRHTIVNGQLKNAKGKTNLFIDVEKCKTLDKGLKLTKLKDGGSYVEDDSTEWQHCTTALGYWLARSVKERGIGTKFIKTKVN